MVKPYRQHNCERQHRTYLAMAKCIWPRAIWIQGSGEFASVSYCGHYYRGGRSANVTVLLWPTETAAKEALKLIDAGGCGGQCTKDHDLIRLVLL